MLDVRPLLNIEINGGFDDDKDATRDYIGMKGFIDWTEYGNYVVQKKGFKDFNEYHKKWYGDNKEYATEYVRNWCHNKGLTSPMEDNDTCSLYKGIIIGERKIGRNVLPIIFSSDIKKEVIIHNPGFDFIVKEYTKIDIKTAIFNKTRNSWNFAIRHNDTADKFLLIGLSLSDDGKLILNYIWLFDKNDVIKFGDGRIDKFYKRGSMSISNSSDSSMYLRHFQKYEQIEKFRELKNINKILIWRPYE